MYWKHWSDGYICLGPQSSCQVQKVWRQKNITALKHLTAVKCLQPLINNHTKERQCDQKQSPHIETCTTMLPRLYLQYYCNTDFLTSSSILNTTEQTICLLLMPFETQVNRWHQLRKWTLPTGGGGVHDRIHKSAAVHNFQRAFSTSTSRASFELVYLWKTISGQLNETTTNSPHIVRLYSTYSPVIAWL